MMRRQTGQYSRRNPKHIKGDRSELTLLLHLFEKEMDNNCIGPSERKEFIGWVVGKLCKEYKEERMNRRIVIEEAIRRLGIRFPNGTVKKEYKATFEIPAELLTSLHNLRLEGIEPLGLQLMPEEQGKFVLTGRPLISGDYKLKLLFDTERGEPTSEIDIPVAFNPNPRDLWVDKPTDKDIPYYKPDSEHGFVKVTSGEDNDLHKDIVAASLRGRSHAQEGKARDDHFGIYHCNHSDWYVIAVADGAGSAKYSRKGSEIACKTVVAHCKNLLYDNPEFEAAIIDYASDRENIEKRKIATHHVIDIVLNGAKKAQDAVRKVADAHEDSKLKDYATTLMFAICKKYDFGWFIASFWVGDGAMGIYNEQTETIKLLGTPDEGEFSGQTRFLTMPEIFHDKDVYLKRLRMAIVPDFTALFLMTDGVSDPMFETDRNLNDFNKWKEFYEKLNDGFPEDEITGVKLSENVEGSAERLLKWLEFWSPGNHDDRTIAILY